jgi:CDP-glucose 4,6-dehydratase
MARQHLNKLLEKYNTMNFWKNKKVLITGIQGFVGSHLAQALQKKGAIVWGISRSVEKENVLKANIIDYSRIDEIIKEKHIAICFHLAAESIVESGQEDPYQTLKINILGTLNILESARKNKLEKVIIASTVHVYGDNPLPFKEEYTPRPTRPYETSKTCLDIIAQSYTETFHLPVLTSRFCNIYGPGDRNYNRLIPKTIKSVLNNKEPLMWGGRSLRDYLYIDDVISAYLKLAEIDVSIVGKNRIFNFGTGEHYTVEEVIKKIIRVAGKDTKIKKIQEERTNEIIKQYVSSRKAKKLLDWSSKIRLEEGLKKTVIWYRKYSDS